MSISKKKRQQVWNKSGGFCWYCGQKLEKGWHVDHIVPRFREHWREVGDIDEIDNLAPSCVRCNLFKSVYTVEQFRNKISKQPDRGRKSSVNFRTAERFGLIQIVDKPVVFWFEQQGKAGE